MNKFWYFTVKKPIYLFFILFIGSIFFIPLFGKGFSSFTEKPADVPFPEIVRKNGKYTLYVDGRPYLILGAQLWNSSAWPSILPGIWPQMKELNCNTIEAPVYWEAIEPEPEKFNFAEVDSLVYGARNHGLRLVLLWFGSFKNVCPHLGGNPAREISPNARCFRSAYPGVERAFRRKPQSRPTGLCATDAAFERN